METFSSRSSGCNSSQSPGFRSQHQPPGQSDPPLGSLTWGSGSDVYETVSLVCREKTERYKLHELQICSFFKIEMSDRTNLVK